MPFQKWFQKEQNETEGEREMAEVNEGVEEFEDEEGEEEEGNDDVGVSSQYMTAEQVQKMMDGQAQTLMQGFQQTLQQVVPQGKREEDEEKPIEAPSHAQMQAALEEGDFTRYMQMQAQRESAIYQASVRDSRKEINTIRNEGLGWVAQTNKQLVDQSVPDYKKYQKDVDALADQLGIDAVARTNPDVVSLLTSTVRGRPENIEKEFQIREEARKRQANGDGVTSDGGSGRGRVGNAREDRDREPVFSAEAMQALEGAGKSGEDFAKQMGYKDWDEYEKAASTVYTDERAVPKWRRGKGVK
jgi:hypothetical protein